MSEKEIEINLGINSAITPFCLDEGQKINVEKLDFDLLPDREKIRILRSQVRILTGILLHHGFTFKS